MQNAMLETLHLAVCKRQKADLIFNLLILKDFFIQKLGMPSAISLA